MLSPRLIRLAFVCALAVALAAVLGGCSSTAQPAQQAQQTSADTSAQSAEPTPSEQDGLHVSKTKVTGDEIAVVTTSKGVIKFKFFAKDAPNTVASFIELANAKFFDGTKWHRVVPGFVIQGGDPLSKTDDPNVGSGGPGWKLKAEFNSQKHLTGTVAMARAQDVDSAGSQFYICLAPQPTLDGQYTVFGQVTSGMDVVQKIEQGDAITSIRVEHGK
jgi:peptidyl-prolyl cis-trans isomerase B (cyclophilin B)